jgi:hypothetical protein
MEALSRVGPPRMMMLISLLAVKSDRCGDDAVTYPNHQANVPLVSKSWPLRSRSLRLRSRGLGRSIGDLYGVGAELSHRDTARWIPILEQLRDTELKED